MNTHTRLIRQMLILHSISMLLLLPIQPVFGQRQAPAQRHQHVQESERMHSRRENAGQQHRGGMQWLLSLRESDPDTYQSLQELRESDPEAFMERAREHMLQQRRNALLERHPALQDFLENLPTEEREALEADLFPFARRERGRREGIASPHAEPVRRMRGRKIDPAQFDARTQHFEEELERAEKRIEHLRELLKRRRALRAELIGTE